VPGETKNAAHRVRGRSRDSPASTPRSAGFQVETAYLASQYRDLVPKHQHLDRVGASPASHEDDQLQDLTEDQIAERENRDRQHAAKLLTLQQTKLHVSTP